MEQTEFTQKVVSPEVSKLNHTITNKKPEDKIQFSPKKQTPEKGKCIHHLSTHHTG